MANRGEIALRVIRACREMGIEVVVAYSEADRDQHYLDLADDAICIGGATAVESYLNIPAIISAAEVMDVDAIHPGYGFLAENSHFAEICESCNIKLVGPSSSVMAMLGDKVAARRAAEEAGVPLLPGSRKEGLADEDLLKEAHKIGFPVIVKAAGGGGGRGMRIAHNDVALAKCLIAARAEAEAAFKNPSVYVEKFVERGRHVEIQVMADSRGNVVHFGERDCSIQRRFQKLIEESPSPAVDARLREEMGDAAVRLMKHVGYENAATVEFLLDTDGSFYFLEVNTRIQVEHPVTEMVTGVDLVKLQLTVAGGDPLPLEQGDVSMRGHALECRINAEDPDADFRPSPGKVTGYYQPGGPGVRVDSHMSAGMEIPPYYDSMVAKLITHGSDRQEAIVRMRRALSEYVVEGVPTTIPLHRRILDHERFVSGDVHTSFLEQLLAAG